MKRIYIIFAIFLSQNAFALINNTVSNACGVRIHNLRAVFVANTYTCNAGYFLPANTPGCQPCPTEHLCSGGTFSFNERQSQGIVYKRRFTQNSADSCARNISHKMVAVFRPNNLNLIFDDNNGNTSNATCTYNGLINLPDEPSRPGYVFRGWQLQTNND